MTNPIEGADYFIHVIPFPSYRLGGVVTVNDDGTYSVYINARMDAEHQRKAFAHELRHIKNDDLYNGTPIEEIENV